MRIVTRRGREVTAGADGDRVRRRILRGHVEGLGRRDADSAALADGEVVVAAVAADHAARAVEDVALAVVEVAVAPQESGLALAGEEAEVLALGLAGDREFVAGCDLPHLGLGQLGQRETEPRQHRRRQAGEHVALVLGRVGAGGEQRAVLVADDSRVVAGDQPFGSEPFGEVGHRREPHLAVADDAGIWRRPGRVAGEVGADDPATEVLLEIEGDVGDVDRVGDGSGAEDRLGRAAGLRPVGLLVGPELDRDPDDVGATLPFEQRRDRAVDSARHRDGDAALAWRRQPRLARRRGREGAMEGVGRELRGVELGRGEAAESRVDLIAADPRHLEYGLAVDHLGDRRRCGPGGAAALGVEGD